MTMIADDPEGAEAIATSWQATGGGEAAIHCQALAAIASGDTEAGADMLEKLARGGKIEGLTRAVVLSQAAEARLIADQAEPALNDLNEALAISPDDADLLIGRADAYDALDRAATAMDDLNQALLLAPSRGDALVLRASIWRGAWTMLDERGRISTRRSRWIRRMPRPCWNAASCGSDRGRGWRAAGLDARADDRSEQ